MSLSKTLFPLLSTGLTQEDGTCPNVTEKLLTGMEASTNEQHIEISVSCVFLLYHTATVDSIYPETIFIQEF